MSENEVLTCDSVPVSDPAAVSYKDLIVECGVSSEDPYTVVISGKIPKPSIYHEGQFVPQTQTVRLVINRHELVAALKGESHDE